MASTSPRNPEHVDWDLLWKRLFLIARSLIAKNSEVDSYSPEDLVNRAFEEFFSSSNGLGWDGTNDGLTRLLATVVKRRYIDRERRSSHVDKEDPDEVIAHALVEDLDACNERIAGEQLQEILNEAVAAHPREAHLRDFIAAVGMLEDKGMIDKQLARILEVSEQEIRNRRRILRRIVTIDEIRAAAASRRAR